MTDQHNPPKRNAISSARSQGDVSRPGVVHHRAEPGSTDALQQLVDHCNFLNAHERRDIEWIVTGEPGNRTVASRPFTRNR